MNSNKCQCINHIQLTASFIIHLQNLFKGILYMFQTMSHLHSMEESQMKSVLYYIGKITKESVKAIPQWRNSIFKWWCHERKPNGIWPYFQESVQHAYRHVITSLIPRVTLFGGENSTHTTRHALHHCWHVLVNYAPWSLTMTVNLLSRWDTFSWLQFVSYLGNMTSKAKCVKGFMNWG